MKLFYIALVFTTFQSYAQRSIQISYEQYPGEYDSASISKLPKNVFKWRMIYNDSFALVYGFLKGGDKINEKRSKVIGGKLVHHTLFYDFAKNKKYDEVNFPKTERFLLEHDSTSALSWQTLPYTKTILGFTCKAAMATQKDGKIILVYYTTELKFTSGVLFYKDAPGTVLEAIDQGWGKTGNHFIAVDIKKLEKQIEAPKKVEIMTWGDYPKRKEWQINKHPL